MLPSEMVVLMAVASAGKQDEKLLTRPLDVIGEYIGYLCSSLIRRDYLKDNKPKGYRLTAKGLEAICEFIARNQNKSDDIRIMLQQLGIDIDPEIARLEREKVLIGL
ncbi:MAG: hypothetical protein ABH934_04390 [Chloroflexota bacterium]